MNNLFAGMFKKLKSIKHIEIILALLIAVIILLVYFSSSGSEKTQKTITTSTTSASIYTQEIEEKLANILSKINGAGDVSVMIMLANQTELETTKLPDISSVIIVSSGAKDVKVKLELIKAVESLLNLNTKSIEVLEGGWNWCHIFSS